MRPPSNDNAIDCPRLAALRRVARACLRRAMRLPPPAKATTEQPARAAPPSTSTADRTCQERTEVTLGY